MGIFSLESGQWVLKPLSMLDHRMYSVQHVKMNRNCIFAIVMNMQTRTYHLCIFPFPRRLQSLEAEQEDLREAEIEDMTLNMRQVDLPVPTLKEKSTIFYVTPTIAVLTNYDNIYLFDALCVE